MVMLEEFVVQMTPFGRERKVRVYLPVGYAESGKAYPVLYMHDGQNLYRDEDASFGTSWGLSDYLDGTGLGLIVVGIDCCPEGYGRLNEYGPWVNPTVGQELLGVPEPFGGEGGAYIDWIVRELKPLIDGRYRTLADDTGMAGSSMGGLISTYAACLYPQVFRRVAAVSSAYWFSQPEMEVVVRRSDLSAVERFYMDVGTHEGSSASERLRYVESSQAMYELLREKVRQVRFDVAEGAEHNEAAWRRRVPEMLGFLYGA
jgi:predicted alpha/beta superfamily hydrolase